MTGRRSSSDNRTGPEPSSSVSAKGSASAWQTAQHTSCETEMERVAEVAKEIIRRDVRNRWLMSGPALLTIFLAAAAPLLIVLLYSLMVKGDYGDVKYWQFSTDGWVSVLFERDPI